MESSILQFLAHLPSVLHPGHEEALKNLLHNEANKSVISPEGYAAILRATMQFVNLLESTMSDFRVNICGSLKTAAMLSTCKSVDLYLQPQERLLQNPQTSNVKNQLLLVYNFLQQHNSAMFNEMSDISLINHEIWTDNHIGLSYKGYHYRLWTDVSLMHRTVLLNTYLTMKSDSKSGVNTDYTRLVLLLQRLLQNSSSIISNGGTMQQSAFHLSDDACAVLVIFYLQNAGPPAYLPHLHHLLASWSGQDLPASAIKSFPVLRQSYLCDMSIISQIYNFPCPVSLATLWMNMLRFYLFSVPLFDVKISIESWHPVLLTQMERQNTPLLFITDPMNPIRNLCTTQLPPNRIPYTVSHFQEVCARALYYFSVPPMIHNGNTFPLFTHIHLKPSQVNVSLSHNIKICRVYPWQDDFASSVKLFVLDPLNAAITIMAKRLSAIPKKIDPPYFAKVFVSNMDSLLQSVTEFILKPLWTISPPFRCHVSQAIRNYVLESFIKYLVCRLLERAQDIHHLLNHMFALFIQYAQCAAHSCWTNLWKSVYPMTMVLPLKSLLILLEHSFSAAVLKLNGSFLPCDVTNLIVPKEFTLNQTQLQPEHWRSLLHSNYKEDGLILVDSDEPQGYNSVLLKAIMENRKWDDFNFDHCIKFTSPLNDIVKISLVHERDISTMSNLYLPWESPREESIENLVVRMVFPKYEFERVVKCPLLLMECSNSSSSEEVSHSICEQLGARNEDGFFIEPVFLEINGFKVLVPVVSHHDRAQMEHLGKKLLPSASPICVTHFHNQLKNHVIETLVSDTNQLKIMVPVPHVPNQISGPPLQMRQPH